MKIGLLSKEWLEWWQGLNGGGRWLPGMIVGGYGLVFGMLGGLQADHYVFMGIALVGYYAGPRLRPLARLGFPLILALAFYKSQPLWIEVFRGKIRVAELHNWELAWFGVVSADGLITWAAWWQQHTHVALDLLVAVPYLVFGPAYSVMALWWRFGRVKSEFYRARRTSGAERAMWAYLWVTVLGIAGYVIYPAAPPWYVQAHGLGPAQLDVLPSAAGALRIDALLGWPIFESVYTINPNVFGAMPSIHCAVPWLGFLYAVRLRLGQLIAAGWFGLIAFGSVYLNHHYILDGLVGVAIATLVFLVIEGPRKSSGSSPRQATH